MTGVITSLPRRKTSRRGASDDVILAPAADLIKNKTASGLELALLTAALLENAGINATFGRSGGEWYAGAFLTEDCFGETVTDDPSAVENRLSRGVNALSVFGLKGLFEGENFETNERRAAGEIKNGFDFFVDLFYSRISGIRPLPERVASPSGGYDVKEAEDYASVAPKKIEEIEGNLSGDKTVTREKQWERRLLDLDMRNPLLNFKPSSYAVPVLTARLGDFIEAASKADEFELRPTSEEEKTLAADLSDPFNKETSARPVRDFVFYEYRNGRLLVALSGKGVRSLKAFLEYAERGREMLAVDYRNAGEKKKGIGEYIAAELAEKGVKCDYDLGVSDFKIDVAVIDPRDPKKYILAIVCDGENENRIPSVSDRVAMSTRILKTLGWNVYHLWTINYLGNPRREIARIKEVVAALAGSGTHSKKSDRETLNKYRKTYRRVTLKPLARAGADYVLDENNSAAIANKAEAVIRAEGPVSENYVLARLGEVYSVPQTSKKARANLLRIVRSLTDFTRNYDDATWYAEADPTFFRPLDDKTERDIADVCPRELAVAVRCAVERNAPVVRAELVKAVALLMNCPRRTPKVVTAIDSAIDLAASCGLIIPTVDGKYTI